MRKHALVRWQIGLLAILSGSAMWLLWIYQPYMQLTGWPVWSFGIAFAAFNLFAAFVSEKAAAVEERFGQRGTLLLLMGLQAVPPLLMGLFVHPFAVVLIFGQQSVRALARPIIADRLLLRRLLSSCDTRRNLHLCHKKRVLPLTQEDISSCATRRTPFLCHKKTL